MKRVKRLCHSFLILVLSCPLLTGCWDRLDPENMAFIMALGIDQGPNNDYIFTFALAVPKSSADGGQSSGGSQTNILAVHSEESADISAALLASQSFIARRLTFIHSKTFILGEGLGHKGVIQVLGEAVRNREIRRTVNVITTTGKAETFIHHILPTTERDINLWFELELDPTNVGATIPRRTLLHDFIMDIEKPGTGAITLHAAPRPDIKKGKEQMTAGNESSDTQTSQPFAGEQYAGRIRRAGEVPVEFYGTAVYKQSALIGYLTAAETKVLNMLRGEFTTTTWEFRDPSNSKLNLSIRMKADKQARMKVMRKNGQIAVAFHISMEGDLIGAQSHADYTNPEFTQNLEQSVQDQMKKRAVKLLDKTLHLWQVDCFRINNRLKTSFSTLQEFYAFQWKDHIKETNYTVDISFKMRRHGDQVGPAVEGDKMQ